MNANQGNNQAVGKSMNRVDGRLKVTGGARYAAEFPTENLAHAVVVESTIARGRITKIDTSAAEKSPGVLAVITHLNAPKLGQSSGNRNTSGEQAVEGGGNPFTKPILVLQDTTITFYGQHIGVVIAETLEQARYAADLLKVTYAL